MKVKKLLALVLFALMAVTMLAACGGGGGGGNSGGGGGVSVISLDYGEINRILKAEGYNKTVSASSNLLTGVKEAAAMLSEHNFNEVTSSDLSSSVATMAKSHMTTSGPVGFAKNRVEVLGGRYNEAVASIASSYMSQGLDATYTAAAVEFTSADGVKCYLYVVHAAYN